MINIITNNKNLTVILANKMVFHSIRNLDVRIMTKKKETNCCQTAKTKSGRIHKDILDTDNTRNSSGQIVILYSSSMTFLCQSCASSFKFKNRDNMAERIIY